MTNDEYLERIDALNRDLKQARVDQFRHITPELSIAMNEARDRLGLALLDSQADLRADLRAAITPRRES